MSKPPADAHPTVLSQRQAECLRLAGHGYTSKEIAREIGISPSTVDNHIGAAIDRLGARNRLEAIRLMLSHTSTDASEVGRMTREPEPPYPVRARGGLLSLPPLGGSLNELGAKRRLFHIFQIALLAVASSSGIILSIAGVVYVLG